MRNNGEFINLTLEEKYIFCHQMLERNTKFHKYIKLGQRERHVYIPNAYLLSTLYTFCLL